MVTRAHHLPSSKISPWEVFCVFLWLGCTAFGGPIAHLGYFQTEFVVRRRWLTEEAFGDLVSLCQFLPGPASSQVGLAIGFQRVGWRGAISAWVGFTLPSAMLMVALAYGLGLLRNLAHSGTVQGLKVAAFAVIAQAVIAMAKKHCPDIPRALIAAATAVLLTMFASPLAQLGAIVMGSLVFYLLPTPSAGPAYTRTSSRFALNYAANACLIAFLGLLLALPIGARIWDSHDLNLANCFYRSGAVVFGGGHVVLPLLEKATVGQGWLPQDKFLAGYGAAQALPGPLFAFSAYLGAIIAPGGIRGAMIALLSIYAPAVLILFGTLPYWERLRTTETAQRLLAGANAAVVGLLAAAFYSPILTSTIASRPKTALGLAAFLGIQFLKAPPWLIVVGCAAVGAFAL